MNRKAIFIFSATIFIFGAFVNASAQCGPAGLDPCIVAKAVKPAVKTVVAKTKTVKKAAASETGKKSQTKPVRPKPDDKNNTNIYDSLKVDPKAKSASENNLLFPVNGVTLGRTTETQMQILGGKREIFNDTSTGTERVYYAINDMNFWMRDGVADSVGIYKFLDRFPTKWELLGFNFQLSYRESITLLKSLGYEVEEFPDLPKLEEIGKVSRSPRIVGTKKGTVSSKISMSFILEKGQTYDSPGALLYVFVGAAH